MRTLTHTARRLLFAGMGTGLQLIAATLPVFAALPPETEPPAPKQVPMLRAPVPAVVTADGNAYLPGVLQTLASARTKSVLLHPQGRYALIVQNEEAPPPGAAEGKATTGAAALLLYDARLNKTRVLWERRADGRFHAVEAYFLPGTDCAVATGYDAPVDGFISGEALAAEARANTVSTVLFFDFEKSLTGRALLTSPNRFHLMVSPTKPVYLLEETVWNGDTDTSTKQNRMGNGNGTLSTPLQTSMQTFWSGWNADGTGIKGSEFVKKAPATPDTRPWIISTAFDTNGQRLTMATLTASPPFSKRANFATLPPLPFSAHTTILAVPQGAQNGAANESKNVVAGIVHPLFLEANDTKADAANHSVLIAPDADKYYLLPDKSAILYESKGSLYAVPLVRLSSTAYAAAQKAQLRQTAIKKAGDINMAFSMYSVNEGAMFPPASGLAATLAPYLRESGALEGFTYMASPGVTFASLGPVDRGKTAIGYFAVPGGRAVVYADGRTTWENANEAD